MSRFWIETFFCLKTHFSSANFCLLFFRFFPAIMENVSLRAISLILMILVVCVCYFLPSPPNDYLHMPFFKGNDVERIIRQNNTEKSSLKNLLQCDNLLLNVTDGYWVKKSDLVPKESMEYKILMKAEEEYDSHLARYRVERGIHTQLWREDGKCGIKKYVRSFSIILLRIRC